MEGDAARPAVGFRLVKADEWAATQAAGAFAGSGIDIRDGYIHMSVASEVKTTARVYFGGQRDVVLLKIGARKQRRGECGHLPPRGRVGVSGVPGARCRPCHAWEQARRPANCCTPSAHQYLVSTLLVPHSLPHPCPRVAAHRTAAPRTASWTAGSSDLAGLGADIRWDWVPSRAAAFPHLYNRPLPVSAVLGAYPLPLTPDGADFVFPGELELPG
jgi:uncharacterized protein (DUF952 family)